MSPFQLESTYLQRNLLLVLAGKVHKMIILCADEKRDGGLIEAAALTVPLLDRIECTLARKIEHE